MTIFKFQYIFYFPVGNDITKQNGWFYNEFQVLSLVKQENPSSQGHSQFLYFYWQYHPQHMHLFIYHILKNIFFKIKITFVVLKGRFYYFDLKTHKNQRFNDNNWISIPLASYF